MLIFLDSVSHCICMRLFDVAVGSEVDSIYSGLVSGDSAEHSKSVLTRSCVHLGKPDAIKLLGRRIDMQDSGA